MQEPPLQLDWTAYDAYGAGDAYAHLPAHGAGYGKAAAVCIGSRTCQRAEAKGVMCPSFRATQDSTHSTQHRAAMLRAALDGELGEGLLWSGRLVTPQPLAALAEQLSHTLQRQALVVEAIQAGAKDFVVKPFQPSRVLEAVQRVLG